MNLEIYVTEAFIQAMKKHRAPHIVLEKIRLLALNSRHPSLQSHPFQRARKGIWECYASNGERILFEFKPGKLCLWYLGPHALVERAHRYRFDPDESFYAFDITGKNGVGSVEKKEPRQMKERPGDFLEATSLIDSAFIEELLQHVFSLEQLEDNFPREAK